jgi:hypothetical protein
MPHHDGMVTDQVRGDCPQKWMITVNILNADSRTAESGWSCSLGGERGANIPTALKTNLLQSHRAFRNLADPLSVLSNGKCK